MSLAGFAVAIDLRIDLGRKRFPYAAGHFARKQTCQEAAGFKLKSILTSRVARAAKFGLDEEYFETMSRIVTIFERKCTYFQDRSDEENCFRNVCAQFFKLVILECDTIRHGSCTKPSTGVYSICGENSNTIRSVLNIGTWWVQRLCQ